MQLTQIAPTAPTALRAASPSPHRPAVEAKYAGFLLAPLPDDHWAMSRDAEGDLNGPRLVTIRDTSRPVYRSYGDAVAAARRASAGDLDAVAVTRIAGTHHADQYHVDRLLAKPSFGGAKYRGIDLEGVASRNGDVDAGDVWQPLQSRAQVWVDAVVDGALLLDAVTWGYDD